MATEVAAAYVELSARTDALTAGLARANAQISSFAKTADAKAASASSAFSTIGKGAKVGALAVAAGLTMAVRSATSFESQMSQVKAVTGATSAQMDAMSKSALALSSSAKGFGYTAKDVATAQTELGKAGLSVAQIMGGGMTAALTLAKAGNLQLGDAAAYTANAMAQFGLAGAQAGSVADAMATAANATTADVGDFGAALVQTGAAAKSAGLSFNDTMTALTALAKSGVKGSDAGTSLKTSLIQLINPTQKQAAAAQSAGISFIDQAGKMRSLSDISGILRDRTSKMTQTQRTALFATLAGSDGVRTLLSLYNAGPATITKYQAQLAKSGTAAQQAATMNDNAAGKFKQFMATVQMVGIQIGDALLPPLTAIAGAFGAVIGKITAFKPLAYAAAAAVTAVIAAMAINKVVAFSGAIATAARSIGILRIASVGAGATGAAVESIGVAAGTVAPRMGILSRAMGSFGAAAGILTKGVGSLGPYSASQTGKISRVGAAASQAKMGLGQLAGVLPLAINPLGALTLAVGVGVAALVMFHDRTSASERMMRGLSDSVSSAKQQMAEASQVFTTQSQSIGLLTQTSQAAALAKKAHAAAVREYITAVAQGQGANESEAQYQARLAGLFVAGAQARLTATEATGKNTMAVQQAVDQSTKLRGAVDAENTAAQGRLQRAQAATTAMALAGKSDQARTAAISELATAEANVGLVEARRVGRLRDVEKQQVATREAIKKSSMTDAEKQASLSVVNREISRTRTELNKVAGTPDPKKKVEVKTDQAQANVQTLTGWLAGLKDKSVTVSVKTEKKAYGGMVKGFATGGIVSGPGGTDRVPAMLTAGEVVLNQKQQALVASGMSIGEAIRRTGGAFAKGGFVKPKQKKGEKKADYDRRVAQARKQWKDKQDSQTVPAIQRASQAFGASFLAKFDAGTAKGLKDLANNFVGTGALAGLTFAGIEKQAKAAQAQLDATYNALTPAEAQLKALQDTGAASDRASAIADAQAALANAQQFGDADAIRNATKALGEAQRAEQIAQLQTTADSERAQREKERQAAQDAFTTEWDKKRTDLQDQLDNQSAQYQEARDIERAQRVVDLEELQTNLEAQKGKYRNHTASIIKMFKRFAQDMEVSGKNIGQSMADGLKAAEGDLRGAAAGLATLLSKWLEAHSPTEKGPMSNLNHWWDGFAPALVSGLDTNSIEGAIASTVASPTIMAGAGVGGSAVTINLTVSDQTFAGMSRDQADRVASQIQSAINRRVGISL